jgi:hypothetical protein
MSIGFDSDEVILEKLRERLRRMTDEELINPRCHVAGEQTNGAAFRLRLVAAAQMTLEFKSANRRQFKWTVTALLRHVDYFRVAVIRVQPSKCSVSRWQNTRPHPATWHPRIAVLA